MSVRATIVRELVVRSFRSYDDLSLELGPGVTMLTGPNGVGKTNVLEAVAIGLTGSSPRTSAELRCITHGAAAASVRLVVDVAGAVHERMVVIDRGRGKRVLVDDVAAPSVAAFAADAPTVVFLPEQLLAIRGAAVRRRALLDRAAAALEQRVVLHLRRYAEVTRQRGALLRRARAGADVRDAITPWTAQLAELGALVRAHRERARAALTPPFAARLEELTGFTSGAIRVDQRGDEDLAGALDRAWADDVRRGSTTVGPHLDDVLLLDGDRDLRSWGSTGEQRAALLAWALAESDMLTSVTGRSPVVLLDEPFAELDAARRERLASAISGLAQCVVTGTEIPADPFAARILHVDHGRVA